MSDDEMTIEEARRETAIMDKLIADKLATFAEDEIQAERTKMAMGYGHRAPWLCVGGYLPCDCPLCTHSAITGKVSR